MNVPLHVEEGKADYLSLLELALRPMAGQRTLDPLMVVRIHQGQLDLAISAPVCCSSLLLQPLIYA
jgi:hypothetical protein